MLYLLKKTCSVGKQKGNQFYPFEYVSVESECSGTLDDNVASKLRKLVEDEFPGGLCIDELIGAYKVT